ncbi:transposase [Streptomyces sp. NPDC005774]|uniref:transposase n=1 Tax=Streptomyces sp. NPDC005774 TaxID=3364728 RepID=UPI0036BCEB95
MAAPRKYSLELRERAVRMYRTSDPKPQIKRLAIELGVHPEALRGWIRQAEADAGERDDRLTTDERAEFAALRKENAQLKRANEVLRTASACGNYTSPPPPTTAGAVPSANRVRVSVRTPC